MGFLSTAGKNQQQPKTGTQDQGKGTGGHPDAWVNEMGDMVNSTSGGEGVQTKLEIGSPNDPQEKEADNVADQVVASGSAANTAQTQTEEEVQGKLSDDRETEDSVAPKVQRVIFNEEKDERNDMLNAKMANGSVQRMGGEQEEVQKMEDEDVQAKEQEEVQMSEDELQQKLSVQREGNGTATASPSFASTMNSAKGGGSALPDATQAEMGQKMGKDFSGVNIHTDGTAAQLNEEIGSRAFAHGNDVFFNEGEFNPNTDSGKHLIAHELTHTVQQGAASDSVQKQDKKDKDAKRIRKVRDKYKGIREIYTTEVGNLTLDQVINLNYANLEEESRRILMEMVIRANKIDPATKDLTKFRGEDGMSLIMFEPNDQDKVKDNEGGGLAPKGVELYKIPAGFDVTWKMIEHYYKETFNYELSNTQQQVVLGRFMDINPEIPFTLTPDEVGKTVLMPVPQEQLKEVDITYYKELDGFYGTPYTPEDMEGDLIDYVQNRAAAMNNAMDNLSDFITHNENDEGFDSQAFGEGLVDVIVKHGLGNIPVYGKYIKVIYDFGKLIAKNIKGITEKGNYDWKFDLFNSERNMFEAWRTAFDDKVTETSSTYGKDYKELQDKIDATQQEINRAGDHSTRLTLSDRLEEEKNSFQHLQDDAREQIYLTTLASNDYTKFQIGLFEAYVSAMTKQGKKDGLGIDQARLEIFFGGGMSKPIFRWASFNNTGVDGRLNKKFNEMYLGTDPGLGMGYIPIHKMNVPKRIWYYPIGNGHGGRSFADMNANNKFEKYSDNVAGARNVLQHWFYYQKDRNFHSAVSIGDDMTLPIPKKLG